MLRWPRRYCLTVRYDPAIYDGAAVHYRYGRPAYSPGLEALLAEELGLDGGGRLLDVGCGPCILTVRLAGLFEEAVGLDPDPGRQPASSAAWVAARRLSCSGRRGRPCRRRTRSTTVRAGHWREVDERSA